MEVIYPEDKHGPGAIKLGAPYYFEICSKMIGKYGAKLPQLGRAVGEILKEFKSSTKGLAEDDEAKMLESLEDKK